MDKAKKISAVCLIAMTLAGCGANTEDNNKQTSQGYHNNDYMEPTENGARTASNEEGYVWDDAKKKIDAIQDVKSSHVIAVGHDAYVSVVLENENQEEAPNDLKKRVSDELMKSDPSITKVYVSSNPEFISHMENYGDRIRGGEPFSGLYDEFTGMTKRIFPESYSK